ncbi:hypothetical protein [Jiangella alba]|uniref:Uncharacterized protein n=1 Tax=Jiangella alba TaxID=561176 RepID=A0A1H5C215_9ACTN|nr:hypothetical protein [Jiangella alba]SED60568.1 hypothetical protein SAMN04488561_0083 [Jiangella alba]
MFRNLAQLFAATPGRDRRDVFLVHPIQLSRWLDEAWNNARTVPAFGDPTTLEPFLGAADVVETLNLPRPQVTGGAEVAPSGVVLTDPDVFGGAPLVQASGLAWDHLAYAYLVESTGVFEVLAEVVRRLVTGETLDTLSAGGLRWLRATEELFFRDPPLFSISGVTSAVRPDDRVNRRNCMWRMFGMDLPHPIPARWARPGSAGEQDWKSDTGSGVNTGFREKWTELLRQVWLGIENARNESGPNATDKEYVAFLCTALKDMMAMRRRGGQLAREEFVYVATMSWFHLTLETPDTPIVVDLRADATNAADRLAKIAQRVGLQPAARSRELFELADLMSAMLRAIELGAFDTGEKAETLYVPLAGGVNAQLLQDMNRIIDLWQSATGDRVKDRPVGGVAGSLSAQPLRIPAPPPPVPSPPAPAPAPAVAATNGRG